MRDPERIYTPKRDETDGLALFAQREAAPEVAHDPPRKATVTVKGGSAVGLERVAPKVGSQRGRVLDIYRAIGPATRNAVAAVLCGNDPPTPEAMNGVQGRTAELLKAGFLRVGGYDRETGRGLLEVVPERAP